MMKKQPALFSFINERATRTRRWIEESEERTKRLKQDLEKIITECGEENHKPIVWFERISGKKLRKVTKCVRCDVVIKIEEDKINE